MSVEKVTKDEYITVIRALGHQATIGAIFAAFPHINETTINKRLQKFAATGELWKTGPHLRHRWFADKESFDAFLLIADEFFKDVRAQEIEAAREKKRQWRAKNVKEINAKVRARRAKKIEARPPKPPKPVKKCRVAGVKITKVVKRLTGGEVVIPAGVKVQKLPGFRGDRFAVNGPVIGGFASLGVGRYL